METGNIVAFLRPEHVKAAEKEKMQNALMFRMAVASLERLFAGKDISRRELEQGRELLARRFKQGAV